MIFRFARTIRRTGLVTLAALVGLWVLGSGTALAAVPNIAGTWSILFTSLGVTCTVTITQNNTSFSGSSTSCSSNGFGLTSLSMSGTLDTSGNFTGSGTTSSGLCTSFNMSGTATNTTISGTADCAGGQSFSGTKTTPTAVTLASFTASSAASGVAVAWQTAAEIDTVGFNVWRADSGQWAVGSGQWQKVNAALIPTKGAEGGSGYSFLDATARVGQTYAYKLEMVGADGRVEWAGPVTVTVTRPAGRSPRQ